MAKLLASASFSTRADPTRRGRWRRAGARREREPDRESRRSDRPRHPDRRRRRYWSQKVIAEKNRDAGGVLITEGLARPYVCGQTGCQKDKAGVVRVMSAFAGSRSVSFPHELPTLGEITASHPIHSLAAVMIATARISIIVIRPPPKIGAHERSFPRKSAVPRRRPAGHCLERWVPMRPRAEGKSLGGVRSRQASDQRQHGYIKREPAHR